jgi:hypothetical protein
MPAVNGVGEPCAGEPHARFEVAGAGNGAARQMVTAAKRPAGETRGKWLSVLTPDTVTALAPDPKRHSGTWAGTI